MSESKKEALIATIDELRNVPMKELGMLKKLQKPLVCTPANPSLGFLSQRQLKVVESLPNDMDRMDKVIDYLVEMEDKYFEYFCIILEQNNYGGKAAMLRNKADEIKAALGK